MASRGLNKQADVRSDLISFNRACHQLGLTEDALNSLIEKSEIPAEKIGNDFYIDKQSLLNYKVHQKYNKPNISIKSLITETVISREGNQKAIEPEFAYQEQFDFKVRKKLIGEVSLRVFFTKDPIPKFKQGIWTKVNGRIVNKKQQWFGFLDNPSGQKYHWRIYGVGEANGLKDHLSFDGPHYKEYSDFVQVSLDELQKTLFKRDEVANKGKEAETVKIIESQINEVLKQLQSLEISGEDETVELIAKIRRFKDTPVLRVRKATSKVFQFHVRIVDLSERGGVFNFDKRDNLIEINEKHPLYQQAIKDGNLEEYVRDKSFGAIAHDFAVGNAQKYDTIYNSLVELIATLLKKLREGDSGKNR